MYGTHSSHSLSYLMEASLRATQVRVADGDASAVLGKLINRPIWSGCTIATVFEVKKETPAEMSNPVYVSNVRIERRSGPLRIAHLPGEQQPVVFSVHGAIAEHYGLDPAKLPESHAATLDYVVAALGG